MADTSQRNGSDKTLEVLLLSVPPEHRENVTRAFYNTARGDPTSGPAQFAVLQSAMFNAIIDKLNSAIAAAGQRSSANGIGPGQLKSTQLEAITSSIKALPGREDIASKKDLQSIEQTIQKIETSRGTMPKTEHWVSQWSKIVLVGFILFGFGYLLCWAQIHTEGDARVDRVIHTQQKAYEVPLWLSSHNGSISRAPIDPSGETQGIIIYPGEAKLAAPKVTDKGIIVIPIK
jgi:hypothetical protein